MPWIQLSTFVLFTLLILALLATHLPIRVPRSATGQHAGTGDGDCTVWHLIAAVEAERARERPPTPPAPPPRPRFPDPTADDRPTGRHHLRT
ncbi:hypothetical protein [Saccharopolyspora hordei]|uniref:Uncharacterized protein n=1 Tax=Saccharopolyspora hordei TaxID=1838 RepID=A0A853AF19_9PSEU|nr:hypothetical protein [Saccharopolyspora hordei]NYI82558.1 hypothetical protein [Saccharopolyspora hordei]